MTFCPSCGGQAPAGCPDPWHELLPPPPPVDLYLLRVTAHQAAVGRLAIAAGTPHFTPAERAAAIALDRLLKQARPVRDRIETTQGA